MTGPTLYGYTKKKNWVISRTCQFKSCCFWFPVGGHLNLSPKKATYENIKKRDTHTHTHLKLEMGSRQKLGLEENQTSPIPSLKKTGNAPANRKYTVQPVIFRGELMISGSVYHHVNNRIPTCMRVMWRNSWHLQKTEYLRIHVTDVFRGKLSKDSWQPQIEDHYHYPWRVPADSCLEDHPS